MLGLVVGFAARATLANAVAGILLAITQPIRIGDLVTFEEQTGEVEDVRLTYTYLRLDDGSRLVVPNERLAQARSRTTPWWTRACRWRCRCGSRPDADADRAIELIAAEEDGVSAGVAEVDTDGVRLSATTGRETPGSAAGAAARAARPLAPPLREQGLSSAEAS